MSTKAQEILSSINNNNTQSAKLNSLNSPKPKRPCMFQTPKGKSSIFHARNPSLPKINPQGLPADSHDGSQILDPISFEKNGQKLEKLPKFGFEPVLLDRDNLVGVLKKNLLSDNHKLEATRK
jgi:hypothetical protein